MKNKYYSRNRGNHGKKNKRESSKEESSRLAERLSEKIGEMINDYFLNDSEDWDASEISCKIRVETIIKLN